MALDEPTDQDKKFDLDGIPFVVENNLLEASGGIKIEFISNMYGGGLKIVSKQPMGSSEESGCGSCSC